MTFTIYHANNKDIPIPENAIILTDPPYGINFVKTKSGKPFKGRKSLRRHTTPVHGDTTPFDPTPFLNHPLLFWGANYCKNLPPGRWLVWDKTRGGFGPKDSFSDAEIAWCSIPGATKIFH